VKLRATSASGWPAQPHAAIDTGDDSALSRGRDPKAVEARPLDPLGLRERGHDPAVDDRADGGIDEANDGGGTDAKNGPLDLSAEGGAGPAKDESGHGHLKGER